ncbi:nucleoside-diphosphate-sugar epimerase [Pochonia chlamydosporia 170]|uniref:Nucleoside-diphosphate-sugar epimerase n=1 Tax=Pochonia chlamydosporia 170 TaxID=1380566 RepID=A0A179FTH0_METCM|nr:nucleoside-diphosphate-sugar epimerase [Pochonia chlamydosporia 170]OAQ68925.1 nucleoside-diphosphate-sugar epimerase [Pochonia chlamydosporia 170]
MRVLITGAAGFIGQLVAKTLLNDDNGSYTVILTDIVEPPIPQGVKFPNNATSVKTDLLTGSNAVVDKDIDAVFVFHGIMSAGAEADFELGMRVNFDATRALLDALRKTCPGVQTIFTSSQAVYGGEFTEPVDESMHPTPQSSYGAEKMMCEYLINEYTRLGFINGLILRLPTISVRPGKPTAAASSFLSGMIREPMQGLPCVIPLKDRGFKHWLCSPKTLVGNLLHALTLPRDALPVYNRVLNAPGMGVSVQDMMDSLARVGGEDKLKLLTEEEDEKLKGILYSWPTTFDNAKALGLGFKRDESFDDIVRDFKRELESS